MKINGVLGSTPQPLRNYEAPMLVSLTYESIEKDPFPTPQEAGVCFKIGEQRQYAFVPLSIVNESNQTVGATLVGEQDDAVLVSFPPTNFGQTSFFAPKADLEAIAKE